MTKFIVEIEPTGLCSTCAHISYCSTRQIYKGTILQCEEFQNSVIEIKEFNLNQVNKLFQYPNLKGLCMNCDLIDTCKLIKPPSGIWHCNEYK